MMNKEFENKVREALNELIGYQIDTVPQDDEIKKLLEFSKEFENRRLYNLDKKFVYIGMRAIKKAVIIIVIVAALAGTMTAYACYKIFIERVNEKNTDIKILDQEEQAEMEQKYLPSYLPEGYSQQDMMVYGDSVVTLFTNQNFQITLRQQKIVGEASVDNEDTEQETVYVNGIEAKYGLKHGEAVLIFTDGTYLFILDTTDTSITKEELISIAESLEEK